MDRMWSFLLWGGLLTGLSNCTNEKDANSGELVEAAEPAGLAWLEKLDGGAYGDSWDGAGELLRREVSREQWEVSVRSVREPLGEAVGRELVFASTSKALPNLPQGEYVLLIYETTFTSGGSVTEQVTLERETDGRWRTVGYFVK